MAWRGVAWRGMAICDSRTWADTLLSLVEVVLRCNGAVHGHPADSKYLLYSSLELALKCYTQSMYADVRQETRNVHDFLLENSHEKKAASWGEV
jgi:hypothetical protein